MSQPSVASFFATRKRRASEELRHKSKVLILDDNDRKEALALVPEEQTVKAEPQQLPAKTKMETKKEAVSRNLQFELSGTKKPASQRARTTRTRKVSVHEDTRQPDIRETLLKVNKELEEDKKVLFEKLGSLSPKKSARMRTGRATKASQMAENKAPPEPGYCKTPTKEQPSSVSRLNLDEVKTRLTTSARLAELRARIDKFKSCDDRLQKLDQAHRERREEMARKSDAERIKIKEFDRIQLEIPVSPSKLHQSPSKFQSPVKAAAIALSPKASPARRLLFEPKEEPPSSIKASPTKVPAYQRYQSLAESEAKALPLPYSYRFLAEVFRSIDTVSAMLFNRKETITFAKLKPAVQELVRRNFTLDHLAQIKTIYPDAYTFRQEKIRRFGAKNEEYELVVTPIVQISSERSGRNTPDEENVLKSALETHMSPSVLLERRRKFYNELLEIVKDEHNKFLLSLDTPMHIPKEKITRWHPEFDVETCREIEKSELPQAPNREKSTAKDVLERANKLFNDNSRMRKAIEVLADSRTKITSTASESTTTTTSEQPIEEIRNVDISIVDTPPATPKTQKPAVNPLLKGIPASLLEKVRARQAAKALEMMTRSSEANKDAIKYARLPDMAKILRNLFVSEKKSVLTMEFVVKKLNDSCMARLTANELEEHIRLICKLLPLWATVHVVRGVDYLKLAKAFDMAKVVHRLEVLAEEKA